MATLHSFDSRTQLIAVAERQIVDYEARIKGLRLDIAGMKRARDQTDIMVAS